MCPGAVAQEESRGCADGDDTTDGRTPTSLGLRGLGDALRDALPVAGRTGTLRSRFRGTDLVDRVRAKTGWIRGASSLSGVVTCADGERRWFSILMNYDRSRGGLNKDLKKLQEQIVAAAAGVRAE